jgi:hypothetical protein
MQRRSGSSRETVELGRKLILTSILALIAPGSAGQVVVGILMAFFSLLVNVRLKPYADNNLNFINQIAQLNLVRSDVCRPHLHY